MSTFTATRNGITIMVYMLSLNTWAYQAERGTMYARGTVKASNRNEAFDRAMDTVRLELAAPWN